MTSMDFLKAKQAADMRGWLLLVACVCVTTGIGGVLLWNMQPARNEQTACLDGKRADVQLAIMVDRSEAIASVKQALLVEAMRGDARGLKPEDRLSLFVFDGSDTPKLIFDRCRPRRGLEVDPTIQTQSKVEEEYQEAFQAPWDKALMDVAAPMTGTSQSAVLAALGNIASLLRYRNEASQIRLKIYGDMAEHSARYSFLVPKRAGEVATFAQVYKAEVGERLQGVPVEVRVLPTPSTAAPVATRIREAWQAAFKASGVQVTWGAL